MEQMERCTGGFSEANKLDEGAFGEVYRGEISVSGQPMTVAVKVLRLDRVPTSKKDEQAPFSAVAGFLKEAEVLSKYRHLNIVQLLGHCFKVAPKKSSWGRSSSSRPKRHCLVYEFMEGGSLRDRLDPESSAAPLTWQERCAIACSVWWR